MAVHVDSASPHEVKLVEKTLEGSFLDGAVEFLVGDKAYDSDALDERLKSRGTILVAPHQPRRVVMTQDRRQLRRLKRRWHVECFFAWLKQFRRVATRYETKLENYRSVVLIACSSIFLRKLPAL